MTAYASCGICFSTFCLQSYEKNQRIMVEANNKNTEIFGRS